MRFVRLPTGDEVPALGLGTWQLGESARTRNAEIAAVQTAIEIGYRLFDTAEMYGDGGSEQVLGAAVRAMIDAGHVRREELTVVSKVLPSNANRPGVLRACERSLQRLGLDYLDIYLLHWRGSTPLAQTVAAFEELRRDGRVRHWGVSNFDTDDMQELWTLAAGPACAMNQVYYSATERGIEFDLLPWQRESDVATMAYCPINRGTLTHDATFARIGKRHGVSAATAALAWTIRANDVIAIPKAVKEPHLRENYKAAQLELTPDDLAEIDEHFPAPKRKRQLAMT
ncbi:MAG: aldo/keto reductase [Burkholderiaceae bacterium]